MAAQSMILFRENKVRQIACIRLDSKILIMGNLLDSE